MTTKRIPDRPIETVFLERWSPRAFDAASMPMADLLTVLEAARWAPSAYNVQPWRLLYSLRGDTYWQTYLSLLDRFNSSWAQHASALVVVLSDSMMPGDGSGPDKRSRSHRFDAGAAWTQLALQATALGYQAHAMAGLDFEKSQGLLGVPERFRIEVAIAIGRQADPASLPAQLRDREKPSGRLPISQIAFAGAFPQ